jgi:putative transposase
MAVLERGYAIRDMCRWLDVSRSGYYAWKRRPVSRRRMADVRLLEWIVSIHQESRRCYGAPRVHAELRAQGMRVGLKRVARLMREYGLRARHRRRYRRPSGGKHNWPVSDNELGRNFVVGDRDRVWVADITYIPTAEGWLYLAVVMDLYSRRIVGWSVSGHMTRKLVINALRAALLQRQPRPGLVHHSDQGSQYASTDYQLMLRRNGIRGSMNRAGDCYDNAVMESFFSSLKREWVDGKSYRTREEARRDLFEYIEVFYNRKRRHSALGQVSPVEYEDGEKIA